MKHFLYIRGNPGTGKITVAKLLEQSLGWKLFWFHDIKNAIFHVVQVNRIPRLMDEVTAPVIQYLLEKGDNIIYVRPSPDQQTIEKVQNVVEKYSDYTFHVVRLEASYDTLCSRVTHREDRYRITTTQDLDAYMHERSMAEIPGEAVIATDTLSPAEVAERIKSALNLEKYV